MENVNTTSTFTTPYNSLSEYQSLFRTMLKASDIHSADQFRAEMNRLMDQPFRPNTIFMHPADMEILRQDAERPTSSRALLGMEEIRRTADTWCSDRYSQSIPPMGIPLTQIKRTDTVAGQLTSYTTSREQVPIYTMPSGTEAVLNRQRLSGLGILGPSADIITPMIDPITSEEEFRNIVDRDVLFTLRGITAKEEMYTPYRTRRTGNEPKPAQVLLNDLKNYLQAYYDDIVDAETTYGALNNTLATIFSIYNWTTAPAPVKMWILQDKELIIHEANFVTFCQWLHRQQ